MSYIGSNLYMNVNYNLRTLIIVFKKYNAQLGNLVGKLIYLFELLIQYDQNFALETDNSYK